MPWMPPSEDFRGGLGLSPYSMWSFQLGLEDIPALSFGRVRDFPIVCMVIIPDDAGPHVCGKLIWVHFDEQLSGGGCQFSEWEQFPFDFLYGCAMGLMHFSNTAFATGSSRLLGKGQCARLR